MGRRAESLPGLGRRDFVAGSLGFGGRPQASELGPAAGVQGCLLRGPGLLPGRAGPAERAARRPGLHRDSLLPHHSQEQGTQVWIRIVGTGSRSVFR